MSHHVILDYFERARSDGMGGAISLQKCKEVGNIFVVARMDQIEFANLSNRPSFGDSLTVRSFVELKAPQVNHHMMKSPSP